MPESRVKDRYGNEVYLTGERWQHIVEFHPPLRNHLKDVLATVRLGRRRQVARQPQKYRYTRRCEELPGAFNGIVVIVLFRFRSSKEGKTVPNNYAVTAWPTILQ